MSTLDTIELNGVSYDLGGGGDLALKADLPPVEIEEITTTNAGHITTGLSVVGADYCYGSVAVSAGQKYLITGWCRSNALPCAFTVDANNTATKLLGTTGTTYDRAEVTIPEGAVTLYVNSKSDGSISATLLDGVYTQSEFAEKIYNIDALDSKVASLETVKADLTYDLTPLTITVEQGWISKTLTLFGTDTQRHTAVSVTGGEVYAVSGGQSSVNYPCAFTVDANNNVTVLSTKGVAINEIITIPQGAVTLYVNSANGDANLFGVSSAALITQDKFAKLVKVAEGKAPILKVLYNTNGVQIKRKYDSTKDIMLVMKNRGVNNLFDFDSVSFVANTEHEPNDLFYGYTGIDNWASSSDCLGPYWVGAVNNIDGDAPTPESFTGGNHRSANGSTTAAQQSLSILINGIDEAEQGVIYSCDSVVIKWTNLVQGYNTTKEDGTGRGIMTESWEAVITDTVNLRNKITALEDIVITRYYGFQYNPRGSYYFEGGSNRGVFTSASGSGAGQSGNNTCRKMTIINDNGVLKTDIYVAPVDLGLFAYNNGFSFFASNGKLYSDLVWDHSLALSTGDSCFVEGYYKFY